MEIIGQYWGTVHARGAKVDCDYATRIDVGNVRMVVESVVVVHRAGRFNVVRVAV